MNISLQAGVYFPYSFVILPRIFLKEFFEKSLNQSSR